MSHNQPPDRTNGWHPYPPPPPVDILHDPIWNRQPGESRPAFRAFETYRDIGPDRTLVGAFRRVRGDVPESQESRRVRSGHVPNLWRRWFEYWRWQDRVNAYDARLEAQQREIIEQRNREHAERIAADRQAARENEMQLAQQLIAKANEMLMWPVYERTEEIGQDENGTRIINHFVPTNWRTRDAAYMVKIAAELRRLALDMETSRGAVTIDIESEVRQLARQFGFDEETALELAREFERAS